MNEPIAFPTFTPPNRVTGIPGYDAILIATIYDPTVPGQEVTLTIDGATYTSGLGLTLTARGSPTVCWTGVFAPGIGTNLMAYPWTVSQTVSGVTWTDSGTYWTRPTSGQDFTIPFVGCDYHGYDASGGSYDKPYLIPGFWQHIKTEAQTGSLPMPGMFFVDDYGYVDGRVVADDVAYTGFTGGSGFVNTLPGSAPYIPRSPAASLVYEDYLRAWCASIGMLGPETTTYTQAQLATGWFYLTPLLVSREVNRSWCRKNLNVWLQWGDHDLSDNLGWQNDVTLNVPNARYATWTNETTFTQGAGAKAWDAFFGQADLHPPYARAAGVEGAGVGGASGGRHWTMTLGDVCLVAPDRNSFGKGNADLVAGQAGYNAPLRPVTSLGTTQITETLTALQAHNKPFTLFGMSVSMRYFGAGPNFSLNSNNAQHPIYDHAITEFRRLVTQTGQTPQSLMESPVTNGDLGVCVFLHGDLHVGQVMRLQAPAYGGNAAEKLYEITSASMSRYITNPSAVTYEGAVSNNLKCEYHHSFHDSYVNGSNQGFHGMLVEVYGASKPKEIRVYQRNYKNITMWGRKFKQYCGNYGYSLDEPGWTFPKIKSATLAI